MKAKLAALLLFFAIAVPGVTVVANPTPAYACPNDTLFLIPAWYRGLQDGCEGVKAPGKADGDVQSFVIKVVLNVVSAVFVIVGYAAAFFVMKGGFLYILARGEPSGIASAKTTITNAIIGLIISILAAAIVTAIGGAIR